MSSPSSTKSNEVVTDPKLIEEFNRGPITTVFTPPTSCVATPTLAPEQSTFYFGHLRETRRFDRSCFPEGNTRSLDNLNWGLYYYSPAQCPLGWEQVQTWSSVVSGWTTTMSLGSDTSAALCCPTGYSSATSGGHGHKCASSFTRDQVIPYYFPVQNGAGAWDVGNVSTTTHASPAPSEIFGDGIVVLWQKSDEAIFSAAARETSPSVTPTDSAPNRTPSTDSNNPKTTAPPAALPPSNTSEGGVSTGAKAGIGIGAACAMIAIAAIIWLLFRLRKKTPPEHKSFRDAPPELDAEASKLTEAPAVEVQTSKELYARQERVHELPCNDAFDKQDKIR